QANPAEFGELAKIHSQDTASASAHGLIPPISMHVGDKEIERIAFGLKEGEVSPIVKVANTYIILKCDKHLPQTYVSPQNMDDARQRLTEKLHDEKLRAASTDLFKNLQNQAQVINVYNDPKLTQQYPGVAAQINGKQLTVAQLSEECIRRHGQDVLEGEINRKILLQELKRKKLQVTQQDLDDEIARAAINYGFVNKDGSPDFDRWQKSIEEGDGATVDLYIRDAVWPSVALKKLVADSVTVNEEDLKKGFDANYGERVEVLAIVVANNRIAQTVWEQARSLNNDEGFSQLAAQYSIDPVSRGNDGRVPPIRMHGGQPVIEKAAFALKPGDLSSIVAVEDKFVIMRCIGRTRPVVKDYKDVKDELMTDIEEKKMRIAMAKEFDRLKLAAQVDNFLAGTSQEGARKQTLVPLRNDSNVQPASATKPAQPRVGSLPARQQ
ncbi:MAG TPA: peptidylprolyl isomerase, partial [Pirellulaceae bacterium]|nr:peptidylprolyl isomerase [Pirellulaceae bacterium]